MNTAVKNNPLEENETHSNLFYILENKKIVRKLTIEILVATFSTLLVGIFTDIFIATATFAYSCMVIGLLNVKNRFVHWKFMSTTMILDVLLVLAIELSRHAIKTTLSFKLNGLQQTHIYVSSLAILFYLPLTILGWRYLTGRT
jgi:hypothetical protein